MRRQHRPYGPPGELAVADVTPPGGANASRLADAVGREIVVQQEGLLVGALQPVDILLVVAGAERRHHQRLRLAAGEQRRAVRARQEAGLRHDRPHGLEVAAVDALAGVEDIPAHDLGLQIVEHRLDLLRVEARCPAVRRQRVQNLGARRVDGVIARLLHRLRVGGAQVLLGDLQHHLLDLGHVRQLDVARLLGRLLGEANDGLDDRLEMLVAVHDGAEHDFLGELLGFRLHHQHRVGRAGHDEVEGRAFLLGKGGVELVLVVDIGDARRPDRAHERRARQRQRRRRRHHGDNVGVVLEVVRQHGDDDLRLAAPAFGKQRPDRPVDEAGDQRLLLARAPFALEIAARDAPGREGLLLVVDGERQEVDAGPGLLGGHDGGENGGLAVGGKDGAIGLPRHAPGLEDELAARPVQLFTLDIEHLASFSCVMGLWPDAMSKTAGCFLDSALAPKSIRRSCHGDRPKPRTGRSTIRTPQDPWGRPLAALAGSAGNATIT